MDALIGYLTDFVNILIDLLVTIVNAILWIFPDSPFASPTTAPDTVNLGYITWVLDFPTWVLHLTLLCTAIILYYGLRILARWIKLVGE